MKVAGIDAGSTTTKAIVLDGDRILSASIVDSGTSPRNAAALCIEKALAQGNLVYDDLDLIVSTGHARKSIDFANIQKPEIMATARGAIWYLPNARLVIDIGGQGMRAMLLEPSGGVEKFVTNDKCSAGTGCFLDQLAFALEVGREDLGELSEHAKTVCSMSTTCTIFAESEMVSLVAQGMPKEDIIAGLHESVGKKVENLVHGFGVTKGIFLCGGVARNTGVVSAIIKRFPDAYVPKHPQLVTATGAALMVGGYKW